MTERGGRSEGWRRGESVRVRAGVAAGWKGVDRVGRHHTPVLHVRVAVVTSVPRVRGLREDKLWDGYVLLVLLLLPV